MGSRPWWDDDISDRHGERPPPRDDAPPLDWLIYEQDGVLTRSQAIDHVGLGRLRHLVGSGRWRRTRDGLYVANTGPLVRQQHLWLAVLACGPTAMLGGLTAACAGGLRRHPGRRIHVLVSARARPNQPGRATAPSTMDMPTVVAHRTSRLPEKDLARVGRPPRTTMARSLVDAAQWADTDDEARSIIAAACQQKLTTPTEIFEVVQRMPRARRRAVTLETVGYAADGSDALSEIDFVKLCRRFRLPPPDQQVRRADKTGRLRYLDAFWREYGVHAEVDGGVHLEPEVWWADMRRHNDLWVAGEISLRFPAWAIRHRAPEVAGQLSRALCAGGWLP